jgi:hypothetical protein
MKQSELHKCKEGLGELTVTDRLQEYGHNFIKISVPPVMYLLFHEVSHAAHSKKNTTGFHFLSFYRL